VSGGFSGDYVEKRGLRILPRFNDRKGRGVGHIWFAHDLSFVLMYDEWFNVYNHWYVKLFWVALIPTTLAEAGFIYQTWRYKKNEILPSASPNVFLGFIVVSIVLGAIGWWSLKEFLNDSIYAYTFGATGAMAPPLVISRILARGNAKGQSVMTWVSYTCMQVCWFSVVLLFFGPAFRTPWYLAMASASVGGGIALSLITYRLQHRHGRCETNDGYMACHQEKLTSSRITG